MTNGDPMLASPSVGEDVASVGGPPALRVVFRSESLFPVASLGFRPLWATGRFVLHSNPKRRHLSHVSECSAGQRHFSLMVWQRSQGLLFLARALLAEAEDVLDNALIFSDEAAERAPVRRPVSVQPRGSLRSPVHRNRASQGSLEIMMRYWN